MAKRIGILIFSITIVLSGIYAFNRLHFWERSARIFQVNSEQFYNRGVTRYHWDFERGERRERKENVGSKNRDDFQNENREIQIDGNQISDVSDSLNLAENSRTGRRTFNERDFGRGHNHRGNFRRGSNIQLENVGWFLSVFAMFTVVTIFIDKILEKLKRLPPS